MHGSAPVMRSGHMVYLFCANMSEEVLAGSFQKTGDMRESTPVSGLCIAGYKVHSPERLMDKRSGFYVERSVQVGKQDGNRCCSGR